jgi:hypothetical protein
MASFSARLVSRPLATSPAEIGHRGPINAHAGAKPTRSYRARYRGNAGPLESVWRLHGDRCAHAGTGSAWPTRTHEKGAPFDGVRASKLRRSSAARLGSFRITGDREPAGPGLITPPDMRSPAIWSEREWSPVASPGPIRSPTLYPTELHAQKAVTSNLEADSTLCARKLSGAVMRFHYEAPNGG